MNCRLTNFLQRFIFSRVSRQFYLAWHALHLSHNGSHWYSKRDSREAEQWFHCCRPIVRTHSRPMYDSCSICAQARKFKHNSKVAQKTSSGHCIWNCESSCAELGLLGCHDCCGVVASVKRERGRPCGIAADNEDGLLHLWWKFYKFTQDEQPPERRGSVESFDLMQCDPRYNVRRHPVLKCSDHDFSNIQDKEAICRCKEHALNCGGHEDIFYFNLQF